MLYLQPVSTIISVFRPFSLTKIERSALLNDITGSFSSSSELSLSHVLTPRTLSRRFFEGLCRCRFWLKLDSAPLRLEQKSVCRCPTSPFCSRCIWSWLPRIRSRCGHPLRTVGRTYVGFDGSFWLLRTRCSFVPLAIRSESCVAFSSLLGSFCCCNNLCRRVLEAHFSTIWSRIVSCSSVPKSQDFASSRRLVSLFQ